MKLKKSYIIPIAIFLFALILRIALISKGPYHGDTIALIIQAEKTLETLQLQKQSALGFPLTVILAAVFIFLSKMLSLGTTALAVNTVSVLFSSLAVLVFYYLCLEVFHHFHGLKNLKATQVHQHLTAVIGAVLFTITPIFLGISVYGKSHAPCLFFMLLGIFQLLRFQRNGRKKAFFVSALCFGLMGATRIIDLVLMAIPVTFLFIAQYPVFDRRETDTPRLRWPLITKKLFLWWTTIGLTTAVFYLPYFFQEKVGNFTADLLPYIQHALLNNFLGLFSHKLFVTFDYLVQNFTYAGLILSFGALLCLCKKNWKISVFLLLWIIVPVLYYGNLHMTVTSRYFVLILPAFILPMAYAFADFHNKNRVLKSMAFILFFGISITTFLRVYPLLKVRHAYADVPEFAQWYARITEPEALLIHGDGSAFFKYYADRDLAWRPLSSDKIEQKELERFKEQTDALIKGGTPVYITSVGLFAYNCEGSFSSFVFNHYELTYAGRHYYEDWHGGAMADRRLRLKLYKLDIKNEKS